MKPRRAYGPLSTVLRAVLTAAVVVTLCGLLQQVLGSPPAPAAQVVWGSA